MFEEDVIVLTEEQEQQYQAYRKEWLRRKLIHPEGFVDWSISSHNGDPWDVRQWLDKSYLHNFNKLY